MMMTMNVFCGMVNRQKVFSLISSQEHCQKSSPSQISNTLQAGFKLAQNLSSDYAELSCAVLITPTLSGFPCFKNLINEIGKTKNIEKTITAINLNRFKRFSNKWHRKKKICL